MKIGILTFHWATNYGAIVQAFCLQEYLESKGHIVDIINYYPQRYETNIMKIFISPHRIIHFSSSITQYWKERKLEIFRAMYLHRTKRYFSMDDLQKDSLDYDALISGSDQVLNPAYTIRGEDIPTSVYYLTFGESISRRIGYAVSFGCTHYPDEALVYSKKWINSFTAIGTRETTGLNVLNQMEYDGQQQVVPDPTVLFGRILFDKLRIKKIALTPKKVCVYLLRQNVKINKPCIIIDDKHSPFSLEKWLETIANSSMLITDSYHGMIMAILSHVNFAVLLGTSIHSGMNDRFSTLLKTLELENHMVNSQVEALEIASIDVDWDLVDEKLSRFSKIGKDFLEKVLN